MANDPAFLFYPGDYLRDTQCLSERSQVAYDRIMCEHMRNICISQTQLDFFTKRLTPDEKGELLMVLTVIAGGFQIAWVADSIEKRREYSESRRKNRSSKKEVKPKDMKTYVQHMDNENENEIVIVDEVKYNKESILILLDNYQIQLNGFQREMDNLAWRPLVPAWFAEHIGEEFKDGVHAKNSFKRFYMSKKDKKFSTEKPQLSAKELYDLGK